MINSREKFIIFFAYHSRNATATDGTGQPGLCESM